MRKYVSSLMEAFPEKTFWADANSTLRLTYGKVEGSAPRDGMNYNWFTTIDGIVEKYNTGNPDFKIPERLLELYKRKNCCLQHKRQRSIQAFNSCMLRRQSRSERFACI